MKHFSAKNLNMSTFWKKSVLVKYFITYITILLFPCMVLGLFFFNRATVQINQNAMEIQQYKSDQLTTALSEEFNYMLKIVAKISSGNETYNNSIYLPYKWLNDKYTQTELIWSLDTYAQNCPLVEECMLIYREYDMVFTASRKNETEDFFDNKFIIESKEDIKNLFLYTKSHSIISSTVTNLITDEEYEALLYIVPFNLEKIQSRDMVMVFVITQKLLDSWSRLILGTQQYKATLLNEDQDFLFSYGEFPVNNEITEALLSDDLLFQEVMQSNDQTISLFQSFSESPDLTMILVSPWDSTLEQLLEFRTLTFIIGAVTFLLGFMLVIVFSNYNYAPLGKLLRSLKEQLPAHNLPTSRNEYMQLDEVVSAAISKNKNLEQQINQQSQAFFHEILLELLNGTIRYERLDKTFDITSILPGPFYCVLAVQNPASEPISYTKLSNENQSDSYYSITSVDMPAYNCVAIILSLETKHKATWFNPIQMIYKEITVNASTAMGVSYLHPFIGELNLCMIEAIIALNDMKEQKKTGIHFYRDSLGKHFELDVIPETILFEFTQSLKNGYKTQCMDIFNRIMDSIESQKNPVIIQIQHYHISNVVLRIIREFKFEDTPSEVSFLELYQNAGTFRQNMKTVLEKACIHIKEYHDTHQADPFENILLFVNSHYLDYDLSLDQLASNYGLSVSMISKFFKTNLGIGYKEYITSKRLETAKQMLCSSSMSIYEIASGVGYTNESHFIKKFKMHAGLTPAQFRRRFGNVE